ncbi:MAG: Crp/Fnr family transcriptional regulator [Deinococcota bacterium]
MKPWFVTDTGMTNRLTDNDWDVFHTICPSRQFTKGDVIFHAGDPASHLHIVADGQVKLVTVTPTGNERILAVCGHEDLIGEAFLSAETYYRADAVALTDARTCPISREQFLAVVREAPNFALGFAEVLAEQLFGCYEQLGDSYAPVKYRVAKVLLEQVRRFGVGQQADQTGTGWYHLETALKHEEIASMVTATRVSVSMAMAELKRDGILEGTRGHYRLDVDALQDLIMTLDVT